MGGKVGGNGAGKYIQQIKIMRASRGGDDDGCGKWQLATEAYQGGFQVLK